MGIMIRKESNDIHYLIDINTRPFWFPYILFTISDNQLPPYWYISILNKQESTGTIFYLSGFDELCNNDDFHDALVERERWALDIYLKRKAEIKEWHVDKW